MVLQIRMENIIKFHWDSDPGIVMFDSATKRMGHEGWQGKSVVFSLYKLIH